MRTRLISFSIIVLMALIVPSLNLPQTAVSAELSVRQQVDSLTLNLVRNISAAKNLSAKINILEKYLGDAQRLRDINSRQKMEEELYMDFLLGAIKTLPVRKFDLKECANYRTKMISQYDPKGGESKSQALRRALEIHKSICAI